MAGFKSIAQRDKCKELVAAGKMKLEHFEQMDRETEDLTKLPERIHPKQEKPAAQPQNKG